MPGRLKVLHAKKNNFKALLPTNPRQGELIMDKTKEVAVVDKKSAIKKKKSQAVAVPVTMEQIMLEAVQQKDVTVLRELLAFQKELDVMEAEKAFNFAMSQFRSECPIIERKTDGAALKDNAAVILWKYADLADIEVAIKPHLAKNGLSYTWDSQDIIREGKPGKETICWVSHILGHKASGTFTSSIDPGTSAMNAIQKEGSTIEYGRRWSLKLALGIVVKGEDDDGQASGKAGMQKEKIQATNGLITDNDVKKITAMINKSASLETLVLSAYGVATIALIKKVDFKDCIGRIEQFKIAQKKES